MRVRVWINGSEGPSHDFELVEAPRIGERISISMSGHVEEGIVTSVSWQLQGISRPSSDLALEGEPVGSVTMVHVVCSPTAELVKLSYDQDQTDVANQAGQATRQ